MKTLLCVLMLIFSIGCSKKAVTEPNLDSLQEPLDTASTRVYIRDDIKIPGIKERFYIVNEKRDTFHYAVTDNDSIFLWAIVRDDGIHMIRDL